MRETQLDHWTLNAWSVYAAHVKKPTTRGFARYIGLDPATTHRRLARLVAFGLLGHHRGRFYQPQY